MEPETCNLKRFPGVESQVEDPNLKHETFNLKLASRDTLHASRVSSTPPPACFSILLDVPGPAFLEGAFEHLASFLGVFFVFEGFGVVVLGELWFAAP